MKLSASLITIMALIPAITGCHTFKNSHTEVAGIRTGSFAELLDLRGASLIKNWQTLQASSYDRQGGFFDAGHFIRIEPGRHYVLMDIKGPGCIDRIWLTRKTLNEPYDLLIYVNDAKKPAVQISLAELASGKYAPFIQPFAGTCANEKHPAYFSYVPLGFQNSCKVILVPTAPEDKYEHRTTETGKRIPLVFYQITYRKFPPNTSVREFSWDLEPAERKAFDKAHELWTKAGFRPLESLHNLKQQSIEARIEPEKETLLFDVNEAGVIYGLRLKVENPNALWIEMTWDNSATPQVLAPIAPFFAAGESITREGGRGLWAGAEKGWYYCHFPMPFRKGARISIRSQTNKETSAAAQLQYRAENPSDADCLFYARRYDYKSVPKGENYTVLDVKGKGHFVGLVMDNPGNMEGDDSFFIDGEQQPSIHGTGTEDFFNFAWGLDHTASYALYGITGKNSGGPVCYRMHLPAAMPFRNSLRITWEHGHIKGKGPNLHKGRYSGVAFYYLAEDINTGKQT